MKKVLFLSTHNSCRSQMAEAFINHHFRAFLKAYSAGVEPGEIHPLTVDVMNEIGLDISSHTINTPDDYEDEQFDYVITMCNNSREVCPVYWTKGEAVYRHMQYDDPCQNAQTGEKLLQEFRNTRDTIEEDLMEFFDREIKNRKLQKAPV